MYNRLTSGHEINATENTIKLQHIFHMSSAHYILIGYGPSNPRWRKHLKAMELNLSLDAIKHTRRFDGTLFKNWKHSMEILFEFKDIRGVVDVSL